MDETASVQVQVAAFGLAARSGESVAMGRAHRHNDIELNFVETGALRYLFGGHYVTVGAGHLAVFWATIPHQLVTLDPGTRYVWVTVPLTSFLSWNLGEALTRGALRGVPIVDPRPATAGDAALVRQWHADLQAGGQEERAIALLEIEARVRRLALAIRAEGNGVAQDTSLSGPPRHEGLSTAEAIAQVIATRCAGPLRVADIARSAGVHPNYAMTLFRRTFGMSVVEYLTHYRVATAQRLLVTTDASVLDIALDAGFGSVRRFHVAFKRVCGQTPKDYRDSVRCPTARRSDPASVGGQPALSGVG